MFRRQAPFPRTSRPRRARHFVGLVLAALILTLVGPAAQPAQAARPAPPDITAPAAIVVEYPSGKILYEKNDHRRLPEASTTKTMTALLTLQRVALTDVVTATAADLVGESTMGLAEGESQTVLNLLYGLLLPSGNDAAMVLARHLGKTLPGPDDEGPVTRFVGLMNQQAAQMGLTDTHFVNPHGFDDPDHYSSAYDLASIAWYDLHNPTFNEIIRQPFYDVPGHSLQNTNELLTRYDGADGVKTGWTDIAANCFIGSATRNGRRLITVTLDDPHGYTWPDNTALLDYGFSLNPDDFSDTLTIARRADLLWFLSDSLPTPLPTPRPTVTATPKPQGFSFPNFLSASSASQPTLSQGGTGQGGPGPLRAGSGSTPASTWLWSLLAVPFGALLLIFTWQRFPRRRVAVAGAGALARPSTAPPDRPVPAPPPRAAIPAGAPVPPRINLLNANDSRTRAERAVAHAYRGQEGASLAEFMLVVKQEPEFEFGILPGFYDMPAAGYLALARAYAEHDRRAYAVALLKLGRETYKDDRGIARMLTELESAPGT